MLNLYDFSSYNEGLLSGLIKNEYYQQLDFCAIDDILFDEFMNITYKALPLTQGEMSEINRLFTKILNENEASWNLNFSIKTRFMLDGELVENNSGNDIVQYTASIDNDNRYLGPSDLIICIYKAEDEWYYVSFYGWKGDFKCDQIEGLSRLFDDMVKDFLAYPVVKSKKVNESSTDLFYEITDEDYDNYDYGNFLTGVDIGSNKSLFNKLKKIYEPYGFKCRIVDKKSTKFDNTNKLKSTISNHIELSRQYQIDSQTREDKYTISVDDDDWFYVEFWTGILIRSCQDFHLSKKNPDVGTRYQINNIFYKCDQEEGLFAFLNSRGYQTIYESVNESSSDLFHEIEYEKYINFICSDKTAEMSVSLYRKLKSKYASCGFECGFIKSINGITIGYITLSRKSELESDPSLYTYRSVGTSWVNSYREDSYTIYVDCDEWFYVEFWNRVTQTKSNATRRSVIEDGYYKCDQEEGLFSLLDRKIKLD